MTTTNHTVSMPAETCVRSMQLMANGSLADLARVVHPHARNREAIAEPPATRGQGPAAFYATAQWLRDAFDDLAFEIHDTCTEGDLVVVHATMSGRQVGPFIAYGPDGAPVQAFPPTGKRFAVTQSHWFHLADGMVIEHWANRDDNGMAMQLGWIPPTPAYLFRMKRALRSARRAHLGSTPNTQTHVPNIGRDVR